MKDLNYHRPTWRHWLVALLIILFLFLIGSLEAPPVLLLEN